MAQMSLDLRVESLKPVNSKINLKEGPLLKWPGGKSGELAQIAAAMPSRFDRYCEPFLGGGAVFWSLPPTPGLVNDTSAELMLLYSLLAAADADLHACLWSLEKWWVSSEGWVDDQLPDLLSVWTARGGASFEQLVDAVVSPRAAEFADLTPPLFSSVRADIHSLAATSVRKKVQRMHKVEFDRGVLLPTADVVSNIEGAYKAVIYTALRSAYNSGRRSHAVDPVQATLFFFLREYSYAAMFRFNSNNEFNVPYGGVSYNRKNLAAKIERMTSPGVRQQLAGVEILNEDFENALKAFSPTADDFVFLDPPYDSEFSEYDLQPFGQEDHNRLGSLLQDLPCPGMLVIKASPLIESLYSHDRFRVTAFDKTYMWTIKERNDRAATHLMITNYAPPVTSASPG